MNQTLREMSSEQLKEMRRQRAVRWLRRPQLSLQGLFLTMGWFAICSAFYALAPLLGLMALAISAVWLVCVPALENAQRREAVLHHEPRNHNADHAHELDQNI